MAYTKPLISIVVVGYDMPRQLENTIYTLSNTYQQRVTAAEYEVIVLENRSPNVLSGTVVDSLPSNFRYYLRDESTASPASAMQEGLQDARGQIIGMMIDGAHLLSPGIIDYAGRAFSATPDAFVTVPVYHLGPKEQNQSAAEGYDEKVEQELLDSVNWRQNGYSLFSIATMCSANERGIFAPIMESNCYFASADAYREIGNIDQDFQMAGGGALNLHLTRQLGIRPSTEFYTLGGEGTFHQYHGGVTSSTRREAVVSEQSEQLHRKWLGDYRFLSRNPTILGKFNPETLGFLRYSTDRMRRRVAICRDRGHEVWPDDACEADISELK